MAKIETFKRIDLYIVTQLLHYTPEHKLGMSHQILEFASRAQSTFNTKVKGRVFQRPC
jgi:hypothetical protein